MFLVKIKLSKASSFKQFLDCNLYVAAHNATDFSSASLWVRHHHKHRDRVPLLFLLCQGFPRVYIQIDVNTVVLQKIIVFPEEIEGN